MTSARDLWKSEIISKNNYLYLLNTSSIVKYFMTQKLLKRSQAYIFDIIVILHRNHMEFIWVILIYIWLKWNISNWIIYSEKHLTGTSYCYSIILTKVVLFLPLNRHRRKTILWFWFKKTLLKDNTTKINEK